MQMCKGLALALAAGTLVVACKHEGSAIQKQYVADRVDCRSYAEQTVGAPIGPDQDMQLHLVGQFANCMHKRGWAVNKPAEEGKEK